MGKERRSAPGGAAGYTAFGVNHHDQAPYAQDDEELDSYGQRLGLEGLLSYDFDGDPDEEEYDEWEVTGLDMLTRQEY